MDDQSKAVMIKMKSIQIVDNESTEMELITEGSLMRKEKSFVVTYNDSDATGFGDSITSIEVENEQFATINREGNATSNLVVEIGKKHHCHYGTPYGDMMVGIYAHKIKNDLSETGGHLYMRYTVDINSSYISDNEIIMEIKEK